jgi:apolipoprotein N-acyltransferase
MAFSAKCGGLGTGAASASLSAALLWFGTGLHPLWPLMWLAPLPVLIRSLNSAGPATAFVAFFAWLIGSLNLWDYYHHVLHAPSGVVAIIVVVPALVFMLVAVLFRTLARRGACWSALLALPASWVAFEYLLSVTSPHGTAGSLAYSQLNFLPFLQLASLTGPSGMSFLLLLFPAAVALMLHLRGRALRQALHIGALSAALLVAALAFGTLRLTLAAPAAFVRVGLIASDAPINVGLADEGPPTTALLAGYAAPIEKLAAQGATVIVLPEKLGVAVDPETNAIDAAMQALADRNRVEIIVGLLHVMPPAKSNEARIYRPGAAVLSYAKEHLLPPFESQLSRGTKLTLLPGQSGTSGVAICKDMDFAQPSAQYGRAGVGMLLVPAWDFVSDRWAHGHIAIMRGVESGFAVVRAAKQGYLTVSDDRGRILAETQSDSGAFATLIVDVPTRHDATAYLQLGNWFVWLCFAVLMLSLVQLRLNPVSSSVPNSD